jgi:phosphoglycerate dehydrogenase-like enzyme
MSASSTFHAGFSADFLDEQKRLIFPDIGLSLLDADPGVTYEFLPTYQPEYTPDQLAPYDAIVSLKPRVTAASLKGVDRLLGIGRCGVGYDNVDIAACTAAGVAVYITPAGVVKPMAESIALFVLAVSHNLVWKDRLIRQNRWTETTRRLGREPRDRVIGTVGIGNIAREALRLLRNFHPARLLAFDPYAQAVEGVELTTLETLLRESDYVLINCPLTPETRGLIGAPQLSLMKPSAWLINTARGPIVDEPALIRALQANQIAGAALDVFAAEPLPSDSPLLSLDNVVLTSHSIGWTEELFRDMGRIDCEGVLALSRGNLPGTIVNKEVLDNPLFLSKLEAHKSRRPAATA